MSKKYKSAHGDIGTFVQIYFRKKYNLHIHLMIV